MESNKILFTKESDDYGFLSNFASYPITIDGVDFKSTEQFFQWSKFLETETVHRERILNTDTPQGAKKLGKSRSAKIQPDWNEKRNRVMAIALYHKFTQHGDLALQLIATGNAELVEDAWWDSYWGNGRDGNGQNKLGKLLMELRQFLKNERSNKN